jgi:hypothetical protein
MLSMFFLGAKFIVMGDNAASINKIFENEIFFRISIIYEFIMFAAVILLAVALYEVLKTVNRVFAMTAMLPEGRRGNYGISYDIL